LRARLGVLLAGRQGCPSRDGCGVASPAACEDGNRRAPSYPIAEPCRRPTAVSASVSADLDIGRRAKLRLLVSAGINYNSPSKNASCFIHLCTSPHSGQTVPVCEKALLSCSKEPLSIDIPVKISLPVFGQVIIILGISSCPLIEDST